MKTKLLTFAFLFISTCILSTTTFAQTAPGDNGTGGVPPPDGGGTGGTPPPILACPDVTFKRNNGNGTCWGYVQIRVTFPDQFETGFTPPTISDITYQGTTVKFLLGHDAIEGVPTYKGQGYVSYCLGGPQFPGLSKEYFNIPPANKLVITFQYGTGTSARYCTVVETL